MFVFEITRHGEMHAYQTCGGFNSRHIMVFAKWWFNQRPLLTVSMRKSWTNAK